MHEKQSAFHFLYSEFRAGFERPIAPIINTRIKRKIRMKRVNLNKLKSRNEIFECLKLFTNNEIKGYFIHFIQILGSYINFLLERVEH